MGLTRSSILIKAIVLAGSSTVENACIGGQYSDQYSSYTSVYVAGWVEITLQDGHRDVSLEADLFILASGVAFTFSETHYIDEDAGHVFWSIVPRDTCGMDKYSVLYEGPIQKIFDNDENKIMYSLEANKITFALWKNGEQGICGFRISRTEHPRLFVLKNALEGEFAKKDPIATANQDLFAYMNS